MHSLPRYDRLLAAANNDPVGALLLAVRGTRWKLIIAGRITPEPDEDLPVEVRRACRDRAAQLAA